jgi:CRISPR/Cas system CMR-associated protein Cmr5 small subunit
MKDLEQIRAGNALSFFESRTPVNQQRGAELKSIIKELPSLIQKNGLIISLFHLQNKGFNNLYDNIMAHLNTVFEAEYELNTLAGERNAMEIMPLTEEARLYVGWLKRIAAVKIED